MDSVRKTVAWISSPKDCTSTFCEEVDVVGRTERGIVVEEENTLNLDGV